ncbi:hypothetical protein CCAX7_14370 [Capsulimonas corticalis]|uniref:Uncharacterized protein n=1 Tax=Capsulimonas corticalis TaxID=2219043 RepID=A0A402D728_9BACT|nr:hypothetical protein [Capsulimonas corticalis]BDI29386.1 hypothetical protein CCAX7_14370 [Capsulimonas corticalis]
MPIGNEPYDIGNDPTSGDVTTAPLSGHPVITPPTSAIPATEFDLKAGDTLPAFIVILKDANGVINLSGATVQFHMAEKSSKRLIVNEAAQVASDPTTGGVTYNWVSGDTDAPNFYECEFRVTFDDGATLTCPDDGYLPLTITPALV